MLIPLGKGKFSRLRPSPTHCFWLWWIVCFLYFLFISLFNCWFASMPFDEMPKSEIEKRNMEFISRISRREMLRSVFWFEKRTRMFAKNREICNFLQSREEKEKFWKQMIREEIETSKFQIFRDEKEKFTYHHSHSYFSFIFLLS